MARPTKPNSGARLICLALLLVVSFVANAGAVDGKEALGEQRIRAIWENLPRYLESCLGDPNCKLSPDERALLIKVQNSFPEEFAASRLQFVSGDANPGFFDLPNGEKNRIAITGDHVGDPIIFDSDRINRFPGRRKAEAISLGAALSFLVHELVHHQGVRDTTERLPDKIGLKLQVYFERHLYATSPHERDLEDVRIYIHNPSSADTSAFPSVSQIFIEDSLHLYRADFWDKALLCQPDEILVQAQLFNPRWLEPGSKTASGSQNVRYIADIQYRCLIKSTGQWGPLKKDIYAGSFDVKVDSSLSKVEILADSMSAGITRTDWDYRDWQKVKVSDVVTEKADLQGGEEWHLSATVEIPYPMVIRDCAGSFTSDEFKTDLATNDPYPVLFQHCAFVDLGHLKYRVYLKYRFPQNTPLRSYRPNMIGVRSDRETNFLMGSVPLSRQVGVRLHCDRPPPPLEVKKFGIDGAQPMYSNNGKFLFYLIDPQTQMFNLDFELSLPSSILDIFARAHVIFLENGKARTGDIHKRLNPKSGWTVSHCEQILSKSSVTSYSIVVPRFYDDINLPVVGITYTSFDIVTRDLREIHIDVPEKSMAAYYGELVPALLNP